MLPAIRPGDILVVHRREIQGVQPGEIAFISCYDRLVAHRVKGAAGDRSRGVWVTQGDAVPSADPPVASEHLLGVVVSIERDGRSFAPPLGPGLSDRFIAAILRHSDFALRIWQRVYRLRNQIARHWKTLPDLSEPS